jgi:hypothetical protein
MIYITRRLPPRIFDAVKIANRPAYGHSGFKVGGAF